MNVKKTLAAEKATSSTTLTHRVPAQRDGEPIAHAVRYATESAWEVFPGAWVETVNGRQRCSCGVSYCPAPGAHPRTPEWTEEATGSVAAIRTLWEQLPTASVLLRAGRAFDALEVTEAAGCLALARMERRGLDLGPVICTPYGRMLFLVLPGTAAKASGLMRSQGWAPGDLNLRVHGEGGWVAAPPTRMGRRGCVQWVRRPNAVNRWLPSAETLVPQLAYACGQEATAARAG